MSENEKYDFTRLTAIVDAHQREPLLMMMSPQPEVASLGGQNDLCVNYMGLSPLRRTLCSRPWKPKMEHVI